MSERKYLTLPQASQLVQIPVRSLRLKIAEGRLPAYKPGKCVLIDAKELELFVKRSRMTHAS